MTAALKLKVTESVSAESGSSTRDSFAAIRAHTGAVKEKRFIAEVSNVDKSLLPLIMPKAAPAVAEEEGEEEAEAEEEEFGYVYEPGLDYGILERYKLHYHFIVRNALASWWDIAMVTLDGKDEHAPLLGNSSHRGLARPGYEYIFRRVFRCMLPKFEERDIKRVLWDDWAHDAEAAIEDQFGTSIIDEETFSDSLFQLTDVWTPGCLPEDYARFLDVLLERITTEKDESSPRPRSPTSPTSSHYEGLLPSEKTQLSSPTDAMKTRQVILRSTSQALSSMRTMKT